jgi:hypothetical protein
MWLVRNGLLVEEDFGPGYLYSEAVVQMATPQFLLLVLPNQLQFTPNEQIDNQQVLIQEKVGRIVASLPHTPYIAIGLNFVWHMSNEERGIERLSRELFFKEGSDLYRRFDFPNAQFGAYLSRDFGGCRQKLDIKPITLDESGQEGGGQRLQFAFNFHLDLKDEAQSSHRIQELLGRWDEVREESRQIVESLQRET